MDEKYGKSTLFKMHVANSGLELVRIRKKKKTTNKRPSLTNNQDTLYARQQVSLANKTAKSLNIKIFLILTLSD